MKSTMTAGIALSIGMITAIGASPAAYAGVVSNHHGGVCQPFTASEHATTEYSSDGVRRLATTNGSLVCPLVRRTTNSNGATAYVDVYHTMSKTTSCTLYSYNWNGDFLGAISANWTGTGFHELALTLGAGKSAFWSNYSVRCLMPGQGTGLLMSIELDEQ